MTSLFSSVLRIDIIYKILPNGNGRNFCRGAVWEFNWKILNQRRNFTKNTGKEGRFPSLDREGRTCFLRPCSIGVSCEILLQKNFSGACSCYLAVHEHTLHFSNLEVLWRVVFKIGYALLTRRHRFLSADF